MEKIRNISTAVIQYINKHIYHIDEFNYIFSFPYFKEVLIKFHCSLIFSYYFSKDYEIALKLLNDLEQVRNILGLVEGEMVKTYAMIIKLKGDVIFKLGDYKEACNIFRKVIKSTTSF